MPFSGRSMPRPKYSRLSESTRYKPARPTRRSKDASRSLFRGALDAALAASAAAAFFRDSFAASFLSAATLRGLVLGVAASSFELACDFPGVFELPGVPGVRSVPAPDGAADFVSPALAPSARELPPRGSYRSMPRSAIRPCRLIACPRSLPHTVRKPTSEVSMDPVADHRFDIIARRGRNDRRPSPPVRCGDLAWVLDMIRSAAEPVRNGSQKMRIFTNTFASMVAGLIFVAAVAPANAKWVASWSAPPHAPLGTEGPFAAASYNNVTISQILRLSEGGARLRVHFSNRYGAGPLTIGSAPNRTDRRCGQGDSRNLAYLEFRRRLRCCHSPRRALRQ